VAHQEVTQQPASTMRGREGGTTIGRLEAMQEPAGATRQWESSTTRGQGEAMQQPAGATRQQEGQRNKRTMRGNATTSWCDERASGRCDKKQCGATRGEKRHDKRQRNNQPAQV
jgi:hypothetical protein